MKDSKNFWALDWLRFFLAVYLVVFHTQSEYFAPNSLIGSILDLGNMVTGTFFVLSGFLLTHVYFGTQSKQQGFKKKSFWIARFSTLYPLHMVGFVVAFSISLVQIYKTGSILVPAGLFDPAERPLETNELVAGIASHLLLLHAWNPFYQILNGPSWSLSALMFFYIVFPYLGISLYKFRQPLVLLAGLWVLFSLPGILAQLFDDNSVLIDGLLHRNPILRLPLFLAGIPLYAAYARRSNGAGVLGAAEKQGCLLLIVATAAAAVYLKLQYPGQQLHILRNGFYFPAALAIVWLAAFAGPAASALNTRWSARLGKASLSIFILHASAFHVLEKIEQVVRAAFAGQAGTQGIGSIISASRDIEPVLYLYPVYVALIVVGALIVQERLVTPVQARCRSMLTQWLGNGQAHKEPAPTVQKSYRMQSAWSDEVNVEEVAR
ncbi:acyltransferase [Herbaspirillum sp. SJZ107]|uniref:acyltransferase family protein n=1 Tax=Herbaspirillum sp. SJZ107 TaxID=2572881 RepID=UPI00114FF0C3|nr:acyltransferase [Herbaspirillum sp. SJZ107]TQK07485.1 peptidoglycan/LPS O-acetylase OafA/YrhL [Herbaspirillum sp. SJZ107]